MKKWILISVLTTCYLSGFAWDGAGQWSLTVHAADHDGEMQSTRGDFQEYCKTMKGRWIGEVVWVTDWPGFGKKGDKVTGYSDFRTSQNGNVMHGRFNAGRGSGVGMYHYDAGKKQIQGRWISSGGNVWNQVIYKKNGQWHEAETGSTVDGKPIKQSSIRHISDNGKTHRRSGTVQVDGKTVDPLQDTWRHIGD
ncbi:MAG: hypothetical protein P8N76_17735 [Pirellulaceae bacterium]|nr:hypothetical protein [Planctomycetaceae bacterium]MDG2383518.1 hypothetical protein [Pirellulaceae bacterium]